MQKTLISKSKFLSLILRHQPQLIDLTLDAEGWAPVAAILANRKTPISRAELDEIVATNPKKRFALSPDGQFIRARQGHSLHVDLGLSAKKPPELLYHGTAASSLAAILREGLQPMQRQHVHLSQDHDTARQVGGRHGRPVVLTVAAAQLHAQGQAFFQSENSVWLTGAIAPAWLRQ